MEKKKTKKIILGLLSTAFVGSMLLTAQSVNFALSADSNWWSNNCQLPVGYTSIQEILNNPVVTQNYLTRGTITSIEDNSFFIQSRGAAIYIYNTSLAMSYHVGSVVDVEGTLKSYAGMYEIAPTSITLYEEYNPFPVIAEERDGDTFNTDTNFAVGKYVTVKNLSISLDTSFSKNSSVLFTNGVEGRISVSDKTNITNAIKALARENPDTLFTFTGIEGIYNSQRQLRINSASCLVPQTSGEDIIAESISIANSRVTLVAGNSYQFVADILPNNTTNKTVTWSASEGSTIDENGLFTSDTLGTYTVTATTTDGSNLTATASVEVIDTYEPGTVIENPIQNGDVLGPMYVPSQTDVPTVTFLEMVQQYGDSIIFDYGDFEMVIDGGNSGDRANVQNAIKNCCDDGQIEILMLSHPHSDHYGAFSNRTYFESNAGVTSIKYIINSEYFDSSNSSNCYATFNSYINNGATLYFAHDMVNNSTSHYPNVFQITDDISLRIFDTGMYPVKNGALPDNVNDVSIGSLLSIGNSRYFLCGDSTSEPEVNIINNYGNKGLWSSSTYNIVKANHHCSNSHGSNGATWINGTMPDMVVASAAIVVDNRGTSGPTQSQHPTAASVRRYLNYTDNFYCNMINGTIKFTHSSLSSKPTMSFAGRTIDYYTSDGTLVDRESERTIKFKDSAFYSCLY